MIYKMDRNDLKFETPAASAAAAPDVDRQAADSHHSEEKQLHRRIGLRLSPEVSSNLVMSYEPPLTLPAAVKIRVNDQVLRLERDEWDGNWTLATEERLPRLLTRIEDDNLETQLIAAIAKYSK